MFLRSGNSLLIFLYSYHVQVTSKIQEDFRSSTYSGYWWLCLVDYRHFFTIYVFEVRESFDDIPTELPCLGDLKNLGHLPVQEIFELTQTFVPWHKSFKFISSHTKVVGRLDDQRFIVNCIVMSCIVKSCHVMPRHVTSCHVMPRHVTSCHITSFHVMPRHATSCHLMSRHVTSCHVMSRHVMSRHVTSCHVMSRHATSYHVMSLHVMSRHVPSYNVTSCHVTSYHVRSRHVTSRDFHTINDSLLTDFFHTQLIQA